MRVHLNKAIVYTPMIQMSDYILLLSLQSCPIRVAWELSMKIRFWVTRPPPAAAVPVGIK